MVNSSPEEIVENATGTIKTKSLTETASSGGSETYLYDKPLIEYLNPDEKVEFLLRAREKGMQVTHPDGTEERIHYSDDDDGSSGRRYLLITNQRIFFVAGYEDGDETREFNLGSITAVDSYEGFTRGRLSFEIDAGERFHFRTVDDKSQVTDASTHLHETLSDVNTDIDSFDDAPSPAPILIKYFGAWLVMAVVIWYVFVSASPIPNLGSLVLLGEISPEVDFTTYLGTILLFGLMMTYYAGQEIANAEAKFSRYDVGEITSGLAGGIAVGFFALVMTGMAGFMLESAGSINETTVQLVGWVGGIVGFAIGVVGGVEGDLF